ncbi:MAG: lactate utilization protein [Kiritimatiellae bacterium]|nr:lactate utilization protein [Kiritimatiellia bacterium]
MMTVQEANDWLFEQKCRTLVATLAKRHFTAVYCATSADAAAYILREAESARSIGFGGSYTIAGLGVQAKLAAAGKTIYDHGTPGLSPEQKVDTMNAELTCDLFLSGTNAVTESGVLVNIDGNGNRVAAMSYGPKKVIVVAGRNKIVEGGIEAAIARIKRVAAPANAKRLDRATPCAATGFCADCDSPQRICHVTTVIDSKPGRADFHVLVVNEDLGL